MHYDFFPHQLIFFVLVILNMIRAKKNAFLFLSALISDLSQFLVVMYFIIR